AAHHRARRRLFDQRRRRNRRQVEHLQPARPRRNADAGRAAGADTAEARRRARPAGLRPARPDLQGRRRPLRRRHQGLQRRRARRARQPRAPLYAHHLHRPGRGHRRGEHPREDRHQPQRRRRRREPQPGDLLHARRLRARQVQRSAQPDEGLARVGRSRSDLRDRRAHAALSEAAGAGVRLSAARRRRQHGAGRSAEAGLDRRRLDPRRAGRPALLRGRRRVGARLRLPEGRAAARRRHAAGRRVAVRVVPGGAAAHHRALGRGRLHRRRLGRPDLHARLPSGRRRRRRGRPLQPRLRAAALRHRHARHPPQGRSLGGVLHQHRAKLLTGPTDDIPTPEPPAPETPAPETPAAPQRRRRVGWAAVAASALVILLIAVTAALRFGVLTPSGRGLVEAALDGLDLGAYGRLHVEGLEGDVWRDFTVRRLTIADDKGVWLDARAVRIRWEWAPLLNRQLRIDEANARLVTVLRAPNVRPTGKAGASPLSLDLEKVSGRLELLPAFSTRYGLYDFAGAFQLQRLGGMAGRVNAASLTHAGDRVDAVFDLGRDKTIRLAVDAHEAQGGAIAGALGLAANQPFLIQASATGTTSQGRFQVASRSGDLVPIQGHGTWTPQGGEADGQIALAASRLLAGYQHMLGPQAKFQITGAKAADGLYALDVRANSDNVALVLRGEADIGRQIVGPKGLAVGIVARDTQRVVGWPAMGAGRFAGTFTGRLGRGLVAGRVAIDAPNGLGYRLARVSGPASLGWGGGQIVVQAALDGEGGQGAGLIPALLGGRPHIGGQVAWLPDGRMLIKAIDIAGPGLKVVGTGGRTLFGVLSFKGQASFSNFALAHR